jgi:hypothetical protein
MSRLGNVIIMVQLSLAPVGRVANLEFGYLGGLAEGGMRFAFPPYRLKGQDSLAPGGERARMRGENDFGLSHPLKSSGEGIDLAGQARDLTGRGSPMQGALGLGLVNGRNC